MKKRVAVIAIAFIIFSIRLPENIMIASSMSRPVTNRIEKVKDCKEYYNLMSKEVSDFMIER